MAKIRGKNVTIEKGGKSYKIKLLDIEAAETKTLENGTVSFDILLTVNKLDPALWEFGKSLIDEEE